MRFSEIPNTYQGSIGCQNKRHLEDEHTVSVQRSFLTDDNYQTKNNTKKLTCVLRSAYMLTVVDLDRERR